MKYILMCGGIYPQWKTPKQLVKINDEVILERTIRLLKENGITDIAISTNDERFNYLGLEMLHNKNDEFVTLSEEKEVKASKYSWLNAYYPINEEVCYIHGDVYFSDEAIKTIVETEVKDTMFFCTNGDEKTNDKRNVKGREPLAYKIVNYKKFRNAVDDLLNMIDEGKFKNAKCPPLAWTVYRYLNNLDIGTNAQGYGDLNSIYDSKGDYIVINDYTTDIDSERDIMRIETLLRLGGEKMIKVEVTSEFTLGDFYKIKDTIVRKSRAKDNYLFVGDTFVCDSDMLKYLMGGNTYKKNFVKVIEVTPEKNIVEKVEFHKEAEPKVEVTNVVEIKEEKPVKKTTKKSTKKKK